MNLYGYKLSLEPKCTNNDKNQYILTEKKNSIEYVDFRLDLHNNQYREVSLTSNNSFENIEENQLINFTVKDVVSFSSNLNSREIFFFEDKEGSEELVKYWLYHTFFPILLTFENKYYFLHAGAVEIENTPILFVANSFGGKSTLTDLFIKKGHTMISDDKVATYENDGKIFSVPSYSYHRPYRKMEDLGLYVENFAKESKPINAIFNLEKSEPSSEINISKLSGIDKFKIIRYSTEIDLPIYQKKRFEFLTKIANNVDVYNITIPWDLNRLEEVYQAIIKFVKQKKDK